MAAVNPPYGTWVGSVPNTGTDPTTNIGVGDYLNFTKVRYSDTIRLKSMRVESHLANFFDHEVMNGAPLLFHQVKKVDDGLGIDSSNATDYPSTTSQLDAKHPRAQQLQYTAVPTETRSVLPEFWNAAQLFDYRDQKGLLRDLSTDSNFMSSMLGAFNRKIDKVILSKILGTVQIDADGVPFASDDGTTIAADDTDSGTVTVNDRSLNTRKLLAAREALELNDSVVPGEQVTCIVSPRQKRRLLELDAKIQDTDFGGQGMANASLNNWLNMNFIETTAVHLEGATGVTAGSTNPFTVGGGTIGAGGTGEHAYVLTPSAMAVGVDPISVSVDTIPQWHNATQVAHYACLGATRMDGAKIVAIECVYGTATV